MNLLAGLATCGVCGGGLVVETSGRKRGRQKEYVCHRRRKNGTCDNAVRIEVETMNEAVLQAIDEHALTPEAIDQVVQLTERDEMRDQQDALKHEQKDIEQRLARLVAAIEIGGEAVSLVAKVKELDVRRVAIDGEFRSFKPVPRLRPEVVEDRLTEWRRLLRQSTTQGRAVLQRVLRGRITFTPKFEGYEFEAPTRFDKLFLGVAVETKREVSDEGTEHIGPEDTFDADYGRLLEAVQNRGKGLASHTPPTWSQIAAWLQSSRYFIAIPRERGSPLNQGGTTQNVIAHELGHSLGLVHQSDSTVLMCSPCRTDKATTDDRGFLRLTDGDRQRLRELYLHPGR